MKMTLQSELIKFQSFSGKKGLSCSIEEVGPCILKFHPSTAQSSSRRTRLGFLALIHGNEVIGLPIINNLLNSLVSGTIKADFEIIFALGNVTAAQENKRFIESDLNRSFLKDESITIEEKRAKILESKVLDECDYVFDLHQTIEPSITPFFMLKYSWVRHLAVVQAVNPGIPTVVTYDSIHQAKGVTTNEYLRTKGAIGITIELGEKGFFQNAHDLGFSICLKAIEVFRDPSRFCARTIESLGKFEFPLYQLSGSLKVSGPGTKLNDGWKNLLPVQGGQQVGTSDSGPIVAEASGLMIFPKYNRVSVIGQELFYICTPVTNEGLPNVPS